VLPDPAYVVVDVLRDLSEDTPGQMMESMRDPAAARATFGEGKGVAMFVQKYAEFVSLGSARLAYRRFFGDLTDERSRPALIHCSTGKDRTGWAAASLLLLLDVSPDLVMQDFLASNEYLEPTFRSILDDFEARGGDPELLSDFLRVRPDYLEAALHEMRRSFGTIERYFAHGLQLDSETLRALREAFLDDT